MIIPPRKLGRLNVRTRTFHIVDWRRLQGGEVALCDALGVGKLIDIQFQEADDSSHGFRICGKCIRKEDELRAVPVWLRDEYIRVDGLTLDQVVRLALENKVPPDAEFLVKNDYGDYHPILQWSITT